MTLRNIGAKSAVQSDGATNTAIRDDDRYTERGSIGQSPSEPSTELARWVSEQALPFWASAGRDHIHGGAHERLRWDGSPETGISKRVRVQARQIYCYSHASVLGWYDGLSFAGEMVDWLAQKAHAADGRPGFIHLLSAEGRIENTLRDAYDHAFILLALAWYARATGDAQARSLIDATLAFLDEALLAPDGSYREGLPAILPRRQNPHMHLFEAMLALHETLAYPGALGRAGRLRAMLEERFLQPSPMLREFFDDDWRPAAGETGRSVEPGHLAEWCWLLRRHEEAAGLDAGNLASALIDAAERTADPQQGFLIDEIDVDARPRRRSRRLWPQTEWAKAWLSERRIGRKGAGEKAEWALAALQRGYLGRPVPGGWIDQFDEHGRPMSDTIPTSSLYHIFGAAAEAERAVI